MTYIPLTSFQLMKKILLPLLVFVSATVNASVIDDYNAPLLINGKKLFPYLSEQGYTAAESDTILELSSLYRDGAIESFCKGWGYGESLTHYQYFLNSGAYAMVLGVVGKEKTAVLVRESIKISKMYRKATEPYLVFMKNKAETGMEQDKEHYENYICYEMINSSRMYSAAGISLAVSDLKAETK